MEELILINPTKEYEKDLIDYINEMYEIDHDIHGCSRLDRYMDDFDGWLEKIDKYRNLTNVGDLVKSDTFILVRKNDNKVLGIIDLRYYLNDFLYQYGGNIGYSIRPSERKKGYNLYQLKKVLELAKTYGMEKVLITCDKENLGSSKTIIKCGGILDNEIVDIEGKVLEKGKTLQRYWINLK